MNVLYMIAGGGVGLCGPKWELHAQPLFHARRGERSFVKALSNNKFNNDTTKYNLLNNIL